MRLLKWKRGPEEVLGVTSGIYYNPLNLDIKKVFCLITRVSEQDQKTCSRKSGSLLSLINPAQANQAPISSLINPTQENQAPLPGLINPAQANQANLSAWSIMIRQIRRLGKQRKFVRILQFITTVFVLQPLATSGLFIKDCVEHTIWKFLMAQYSLKWI